MKTSFLQLSHLPKILHLLLGLCLLPMAQLAQEVSGGSSFRRSNDELIVVNRTELIHPDEVVRNAVVVGGDIQVDGRIERDL
ncbi:MAG: hypothetical protein HOH33_01270, partial [Verrucomicrobia bacterium]|nr:hypothetical protein [Verrucomicrobiota bacterium]